MADRIESDSRKFLVDVDSKILKVDPPDDERLREAVASAAQSSLARSHRVSWFG
jgi:hypothetical protein